MSEIKSVVVTTAKPSGPGDLGQCEQGFYFSENGLLTICDHNGVPLRDENTGQRFAQRLERGDDEKAVARKLTLRRYREENRDSTSGFHKRIEYPSRGWA